MADHADLPVSVPAVFQMLFSCFSICFPAAFQYVVLVLSQMLFGCFSTMLFHFFLRLLFSLLFRVFFPGPSVKTAFTKGAAGRFVDAAKPGFHREFVACVAGTPFLMVFFSLSSSSWDGFNAC
jgi:hypothetical protein